MPDATVRGRRTSAGGPHTAAQHLAPDRVTCSTVYPLRRAELFTLQARAYVERPDALMEEEAPESEAVPQSSCRSL